MPRAGARHDARFFGVHFASSDATASACELTDSADWIANGMTGSAAAPSAVRPTQTAASARAARPCPQEQSEIRGHSAAARARRHRAPIAQRDDGDVAKRERGSARRSRARRSCCSSSARRRRSGRAARPTAQSGCVAPSLILILRGLCARPSRKRPRASKSRTVVARAPGASAHVSLARDLGARRNASRCSPRGPGGRRADLIELRAIADPHRRAHARARGRRSREVGPFGVRRDPVIGCENPSSAAALRRWRLGIVDPRDAARLRHSWCGGAGGGTRAATRARARAVRRLANTAAAAATAFSRLCTPG